MKAYRLIKRYPNLPKDIKEGDVIYHVPDEHSPENYPEFWEEIVEKDYQILQLKTKSGSVITYNDKGVAVERTDHYSPKGTLSLKQSLNKGDTTIHSVRRLSDGVVFTVGDKIEQPKFVTAKIQRIELRYNTVKLMYGAVNGVLLENAEHTKPLFQTLDGVDIYEGNKYYFINKENKNYFVGCNTAGTSHCKLAHKYVYFSTKEKAQEYVDLHKPQYSKAEVKKALSKLSVSVNGCSWANYFNVSFDDFWEVLDGRNMD